ncbi:SGNH/GDSL hydrolase family protein [Clostridium sp. AM30-24]|nr:MULTISPECIES: SGNH/GDSL hydrolase family protein [unclassified Clostridium]RHS25686.1 SGNH/GDSL hydrolase family protein [Clostridium sp. AF12-28]RHS29907.1 SGNH/GDSL hydrolase family protein [Clostridium sp. AF12-19]RHT44702.1 SGNH/GDSL hydrolase family protein [Clostridium sp. AM30-24]
MKKRSISVFLGLGLVVLGSLWLLQRLLMPKYMGDIVEGALISEYYKETTDHDVIFVGDCEVYENFSPITMWEDYGITSYIRGSAQQLIWQSYYLLEETLEYEKPEVVVFNVLSMKYDTPQKEAYNRMTLDGMKWSKSKVDDIRASMMEDEEFADYVFPILRYHSRWQELTSDDFKYLFTRRPVSQSGYYMRIDVKPAQTFPKPKKLANYEFGENSWKYLEKMRKLCEEKGIQLILVKAPSLYPAWYDEWEDQIEEYAKTYELPYYNFLDLTDEVGIDFTKDTYDGGLHLNLSGAEKMGAYFGKILREEFQVPDRRNDEKIASVWAEKCAAYYDMEKRQQEELDTYGYLKMFNSDKE